MGNELAVKGAEISDIEQVLVMGDLSKLTPPQRVEYVRQVCRSVGLNHLTRPFDYITLNGKLTLYAKKDATDQLRRINSISIKPPHIRFEDGLVIVEAIAADKTGREDFDIGAVFVEGLKGEARANAIMKAVTKAKRRVTLSISGLGFLDETEVETIPGATSAHIDLDTGEIVESNGNGAPSYVKGLREAAPKPAAIDLRKDENFMDDEPVPPPWATWKIAEDAYAWAASVAPIDRQTARDLFAVTVGNHGNKFTAQNKAAVFQEFWTNITDGLEEDKAEQSELLTVPEKVAYP